ncbi:protein GVQW3-like [Eupeodes corollae]|uniref:protein GVQW3-like n=1 Tax=Eupeodes corollae TaxID=290404 RepID=UPI00248FBE36|nr:protein GVQW3-like [Eupeodes corollae]
MCDVHYKPRVVIQFLVKSGEKSSEILRKLQVVYGGYSMSKTRVFEWAKRFKEERESVEDNPRKGAPVTSRTDANVDLLRMLITSDRRLSIPGLSYELNFNKETVRKMLHENLNMRKICAKMVPKVLTHEQKQMRKSICEDLLSRIQTLPSPDIAPRDFFLFPKMKSNFKRTNHGGVQKVQEALTVLLNGLTSEDYQGCFRS